jgi:hypothetical protein
VVLGLEDVKGYVGSVVIKHRDHQGVIARYGFLRRGILNNNFIPFE